MERLRRYVRARLGYRSRLYKLASKLYTDAAVIGREGVGTYSQVRKLRAMDHGTVSVRFRSLEHPFLVRSGTSDLAAVLNNVVRREYGRFAPRSDPRVLVDAGAYIGDTTAFFLNRFPNLKSFALEPNPESFALARKNLAPYGKRAELFLEALSATSGPVKIDGFETGARIATDGRVEVMAITVPEILKRVPEAFIDILKLDIEGAEKDLFEPSASQWLSHIGMIIVETHGPEITSQLYDVLSSNGWTIKQYRNLFYCWPSKCERSDGDRRTTR